MTAFFLMLVLWSNASRASPTPLTYIAPEIVEHVWTQSFGPWSVNGLLEQLTGNRDAIRPFLESWFRRWSTPQQVGNDLIPGRGLWVLRSFWPHDGSGHLDVTRFPFRLLAIVFRPDLARPDQPAGEGRFVFGLIDPRTLLPLEFYWILEYRLPTDNWSPAQWAQELQLLESMENSDSRITQLKSLTDRFTRSPQSLARIRTNDFITGRDWDFREFQWREGALIPARTENTPPMRENEAPSPSLLEWISDNLASIAGGIASLPADLTGAANQTHEETFLWFQSDTLAPTTRQAFSKLTCNGCHSGATDTRFTHVANRLIGEPARLSSFMIQDLPLRMHALEALAYPTRKGARIGRRVH